VGQKSNDGQKKSVKREVTERVCVCVCAREGGLSEEDEAGQKSNDGQKKSVKREVTERVCVCVCARETEGNKGGRQRRKREIVCVRVCVRARERAYAILRTSVCDCRSLL